MASVGLPADHVGFVVLDGNDGRVLAQHNADRGFVPASVMKLPSALAAVGILGPDHRFRTRVLSADGGRTVILEGGGDPTLNSDQLRGLARALAARNPGRVQRFLFDDGAIARLPRIVPDQPEAAAYNPGIGALNLNFNRVAVTLRPVQGGMSALVGANTPATPLAVDWIRVLAAPFDRLDWVHRIDAGREAWAYTRELRQPVNLSLPVREPGLHAALAFRRLAEEARVILPQPQRGQAPVGAEIAAFQDSEPLAEIARAGLRFSTNMTLETIGLAAAARLAGSPQPMDAAAQALTRWLGEHAPGLDMTGFRMINFSGLSGESRATPRQMAGIVLAARRGAFAPADLAQLIPQRPRRTGPNGEADPEIEGKTGTMWFTNGLAGFTTSRGGRPLIFAIFVTDWRQREALDRQPNPRPSDIPRGARSWTQRARALIAALTRHWAQAL